MRNCECSLLKVLRYVRVFLARGGKSAQKHKQLAVDLREFVEESVVIFIVKMSAEEDFRLREIQREYLDFLDDDVGASLIFDRCCVLALEVKCQGVLDCW